jgi:hypothetical protein
VSKARADDFQVNTYTTGNQQIPSVVTTPDGGFVVAWWSDGSFGTDASVSSVQARRFGPDGVPFGPEFQVNSFTPSVQAAGEIASAPDGRFVVAWNDSDALSDFEVRAQRYASDGSPLGGEIHVNTYTTGDQMEVSVSMDAQAGFVVAWRSGGGISADVKAQRFAADGSALGDELLVNAYTTNDQHMPAVAVQPGGTFVVGWNSYGSFGNDDWFDSVQARRFAADGTPLGAQFQVNTYTPGYQAGAMIAVHPTTGDFIVAWTTPRFTIEGDVAARRYAADGTPLSDEFLVNSYTTGSQTTGARPAIAPNGDFLLAWTSRTAEFGDPEDCSTCEIDARRFRVDGTPYAPEFRINSYTTSGLRGVNGVAVDPFGNFVVTWQSAGSPGDDNDGYSILGAREASELRISNDDGVTTAFPGGTLTYAITASYVTGLQSVVSVTVADAFPAGLSCTWTCAGAGGAACAPGPVAGNIDDPVTLPVGSSVSYTAVCAISPNATWSIVNTATIVRPPGLFDPTPADDTATDVDDLQGLVVDDVSKLEGNSGTTAFGFTVTLASPLGTPVTVNYGTSDGTATAGSDYLATSGTLSFAPGETTKSVVVSVLGDTTFEADEAFFLTLSNVVGSVIVDGLGVGTILNDDSALPSGSLDELVHGSVETRSLETQPGPVAIAQEWRLRQVSFASYEVVVDAVTGDLGPQGPALDRLASDGSVVQSAVGATGGSSRSLRFENGGTAVTDERIRVQSRGCILDCDAADTFRIRLWDTTLRAARFNNSATQVTVLVVQNVASDVVAGHVDFWNGTGALLHSEPIALGAQQIAVLNSSMLAGLAGQSGTLTVRHNGSYGALTGKAVAVEPATGFTFDTALEPRSR